MRKIICTLVTVLFMVGFAYAGLNDRHSNINLGEDNPPNTGNVKPGKKNQLFTSEDTDGDQSLYWDDKDGNINRIGGTKTLNLPIDLFVLTYSEITPYRWSGAIRENDIYPDRVFDLETLSYVSRAIVWNRPFSKTSNAVTDGKVALVAYRDEYLQAMEKGTGLVSPAVVWFRVPDDYQGGGNFVLDVQQQMINITDKHTTSAAIGVDYEYSAMNMNSIWRSEVRRGETVRLNSNSYLQEIILPIEVSNTVICRDECQSTSGGLVAGQWASLKVAMSPHIISSDSLKLFHVRLLYD